MLRKSQQRTRLALRHLQRIRQDVRILVRARRRRLGPTLSRKIGSTLKELRRAKIRARVSLVSARRVHAQAAARMKRSQTGKVAFRGRKYGGRPTTRFIPKLQAGHALQLLQHVRNRANERILQVQRRKAVLRVRIS